MIERKVSTLNSEGEKLAGIETLPDALKGKLPTVVLVHGFGVTKSEGGMFDTLAARLAEIGIASYRFDFTGRGESEGDYSDVTLTKLKEDLNAILSFVRSQKSVNTDKLAILAQSLGTTTTIALNPKVKCIILMGAGGRPKLRLIEGFTKRGIYNPNGVSSRKNSAGEVIKVKPKFWTDFDKYTLLQAVKQIHCPFLFIHGSADDRVPLKDMEELYAAANEPKQKLILEGAGHGLELQRETMYAAAVKWFKKTLL